MGGISDFFALLEIAMYIYAYAYIYIPRFPYPTPIPIPIPIPDCNSTRMIIDSGSPAAAARSSSRCIAKVRSATSSPGGDGMGRLCMEISNDQDGLHYICLYVCIFSAFLRLRRP